MMKFVLIWWMLMVGLVPGCSRRSAVDLQRLDLPGIPARRDYPVDPAVNPCHDLYAYACNNVINGFTLRDDRSDHTFSFDDAAERLLAAKKAFLVELINAPQLSERSARLRSFYMACMNPAAAAREEHALVAQLTTQVHALTDRDALLTWAADHIASEDFSFIAFDTEPNLVDPDRKDLLLVSGLQSLPERSYYTQPAVMQDFTHVVTAFFNAIGADRPAERAQRLVAFEQQFAQTYPLPEEWREIDNIPSQITRDGLLRLYPHFHLERFLPRIPEATLIRHQTPENFAFLERALAEQPVELLQDLYLFHALRYYLDDGYPEFYQAWFDFVHRRLGGPATRPPRDERCTNLLMHELGRELDAELLPRLFPDFPTDRVTALVDRVKAAIIDGMTANQWLSPTAREAAIRKIRNARLQIVMPRTEREWDFAPAVSLHVDQPLTNLRTLVRAQVEKELQELGEPTNRERWAIGPLTVNAYYDPSFNKFVLPIGILQYPFFDASLPDAANFGAIGAVIGHELGHGIDDQGALYDDTGRLQAWMSPAERTEFLRRGAGLVAQFNAIGHNGALTLGENIGDLVGLTFAYRAAFGNDTSDRTAQQAFFLQWARSWCEVVRPERRAMLLKTNPHAAGYARANEPVKHQPGFAPAFHCRPDDPLVLPPDRRAQIW